jgi:hypothetical protein
MEIKIGDHQMTTHNGADLYVCGNGTDDGDVQVKAIADGCVVSFDLSVDELQQFQRMIGEAVREAFDVHPDLKCPACGYTRDIAMYSGDHQTCRRFPFFPGEKGKSHAKEF